MFHSMQMYLDRFGYLDPAVKNPTSGALMSIDALNKAITEFQAFAGLKQTGSFDKFVKKKKL